MKMMTMSGEKADDNDFGFENLLSLMGGVKYYFAEFIRSGVPAPVYGFFLAKKELPIWGVPPSPRLGIFPRKFFFKKG